MKKLKTLLLALAIASSSYAQCDTNRLNKIEQTLTQYGKQSVITDRITAASIVLVIGGAIFNMKPTPLLITTSVCSLANLIISYKADRKLSKHKVEAVKF